MNRLLTNCPNCGAPLKHDGSCEYCDTKVRFENEIDILESDLACGGEIEILLKVRKDGCTVYYPMMGRIESISVRNNDISFYADNKVIYGITEPEYTIVFNGRIRNVK